MPSTTAQNYEQVSYGGSASQWRGQHRQIISDAVATRTLLPKEAGSICCFDSAAGVVYTLPALTSTNAGMEFNFFTTVTRTSNAHKVIVSSATGTEFLLGAVWLGNNAATTGEIFGADGTTIRALSSNGTTTGGIIGDFYTVTAYSTTQWLIRGVLVQSGTAATPFATS
jgi:hypothetical protein